MEVKGQDSKHRHVWCGLMEEQGSGVGRDVWLAQISRDRNREGTADPRAPRSVQVWSHLTGYDKRDLSWGVAEWCVFLGPWCGLTSWAAAGLNGLMPSSAP